MSGVVVDLVFAFLITWPGSHQPGGANELHIYTTPAACRTAYLDQASRIAAVNLAMQRRYAAITECHETIIRFPGQ